MELEPFGRRLQSLLDELQRSQAWLAEESGIPSSTISRLLRHERLPTPTVIESLAPVLGIEAAHLVKDTDAEARFRESGDWIKKANYEAVVKKLGEYESRINDVGRDLTATKEAFEREISRRRDLEGQLGNAHLRLEWSRRDLEEATERNKELSSELRRYQQGLAGAVAKIESLRAQMNVLSEELASTQKSSRAAAILSGVAAVTGIVTVASFLSQDGAEGESPSPPSDRKASKKAKARSGAAT